MYRSTLYVVFALILMAMIVGCSGGGKLPVTPAPEGQSNAPTSPGTPSSDTPAINNNVPEISTNIPEDLPAGQTAPMLFGIYEVNLDPIQMTGDIHPLRSAGAFGDSFNVDITPFLTISPCTDCVDIKSIGMSPDGYLDVTFRTKHPFKPYNRLDLHVFDLRGILVCGSNVKQFDGIRIDLDGDGAYESPARGNINLLRDPDGFTTFYDTVVEKFIGKIFDGNVCPYKNLWVDTAIAPPDSNYDPSHAPEYGFTDLYAPKGHNVFPMGGDFSNPLSQTTYQLDFSEVQDINFLFILEASYGHTTRRFSRLEPRFFLPEFHRKDAWKVTAELTENTLQGGNPASTARMKLSVVDWQAGYVPSGAWDYKTSYLTETRFLSDVKGIIVNIPDVLNANMMASLPELSEGDGSPTRPYVWYFDIQNQKSAPPGNYYGLIAVRDDLEGSPDAPWGVSSDVMNPKKMTDITTYQVIKIPILDSNDPPVAHVLVDINPVYENETLTASVGPNALDPDGSIVRYEYDFSYTGNPISFNPSTTQNSGDPDFGLPVQHVYSLGQAGNHLVAQRVTDNDNATDIDFVNVEVLHNEPPVADIRVTPNPTYENESIFCFVEAGANDPDGRIIRYEYDFYYTGTPSQFNPMVTQDEGQPNFGQPVPHIYNSSEIGHHNVAQRVTDDRNATAIDFVDLEVLFNNPPNADLTAIPDPVRVCKDVTVSVGAGCNDPDGNIVKYEYDLDYTGVPAQFTADVTQNNGQPNFGQPFTTQYTAAQFGNHLIAQRVTDNRTKTDIASVNIQVLSNQAPSAVLQDNDADNILDNNQTVTFQPGAGTSDPDGVLTKYEYDWSYNGTTFTADVTQVTGAGFGNPVTHQFTNGGASDITVTVGFRVTDDGCPDLTDIDSITYTVHATAALYMYEDFETTAGGAVPTNWGVTGNVGNAYYISTSGSTCTNTNWRWGVTVNTAQGETGQTHFLNENGFETSQRTMDGTYTYMNRATIVYTPEFVVPAGGATLTVHHWYDMTYIDHWLVGWHALDGGRPILSLNNPGAITWSDFCNSVPYDHTPYRPLNIISGPAYHAVASTVSGNHPLVSMQAHTLSQTDLTPSWRTNTYDISGSFAGQTVRVGFLFGSDDIDMQTPNDCDPNSIAQEGIFPRAGWRINWVQIQGN